MIAIQNSSEETIFRSKFLYSWNKADINANRLLKIVSCNPRQSLRKYNNLRKCSDRGLNSKQENQTKATRGIDGQNVKTTEKASIKC